MVCLSLKEALPGSPGGEGPLEFSRSGLFYKDGHISRCCIGPEAIGLRVPLCTGSAAHLTAPPFLGGLSAGTQGSHTPSGLVYGTNSLAPPGPEALQSGGGREGEAEAGLLPEARDTDGRVSPGLTDVWSPEPGPGLHLAELTWGEEDQGGGLPPTSKTVALFSWPVAPGVD